MTVLTRDCILREIDEGRVRIDPFDRSQVGVASIDLTLGGEIRAIENASVPIRVEDATDYRDHTRILALERPYRLDPGVTIHGITAETITLPDDLCGFLEGRSRFARLGLMIHVTSAFVQPGVCNRQVLDVRICQIVLMRTEGRAVYRGRFQDQREI
jgi:dCTP deaminase